MVETAARIAGRFARRVVIATGAVMQNAPGICGAGLITTGAGLVYRPAAFIVGGAFLLLADWHMTRSAGGNK